ncbi:hypothetical protein HAX54_004000 [Datura stramonium]|uniref:Uncharacterized protein n=1 Tax=Datura stramonium TaxID=4076 RepID=A0ABS8T7M3_DATST|nr:hypothetical protein [Datura stramonium]
MSENFTKSRGGSTIMNAGFEIPHSLPLFKGFGKSYTTDPVLNPQASTGSISQEFGKSHITDPVLDPQASTCSICQIKKKKRSHAYVVSSKISSPSFDTPLKKKRKSERTSSSGITVVPEVLFSPPYLDPIVDVSLVEEDEDTDEDI